MQRERRKKDKGKEGTLQSGKAWFLDKAAASYRTSLKEKGWQHPLPIAAGVDTISHSGHCWVYWSWHGLLSQMFFWLKAVFQASLCYHKVTEKITRLSAGLFSLCLLQGTIRAQAQLTLSFQISVEQSARYQVCPASYARLLTNPYHSHQGYPVCTVLPILPQTSEDEDCQPSSLTTQLVVQKVKKPGMWLAPIYVMHWVVALLHSQRSTKVPCDFKYSQESNTSQHRNAQWWHDLCLNENCFQDSSTYNETVKAVEEGHKIGLETKAVHLQQHLCREKS